MTKEEETQETQTPEAAQEQPVQEAADAQQVPVADAPEADVQQAPAVPDAPEVEAPAETPPPTEEAIVRQIEKKQVVIENWDPRTELGRKVKDGEITNIDQILEQGKKILEPEIVDILLPDLEADLVMIGQAKGKFGGGQRRVFKQTQKKTNEGNKPSFSTIVVVGNKSGYIGIGQGKARETVPAREKALRKAKLNVMKIRRGSGSWEGDPTEKNSIPFRVTGKTGSVIITLFPAPKGTGLSAPRECRRLFEAAGIQDIWSKTIGQTRTTTNLIAATVKALEKLSTTKVPYHIEEVIGQ